VAESGCKKVVVAVGQWPASWSRGRPTLFDTYYREIKTVLQNMQDTLPKDVEIFARSINYNGLGDLYSKCDPIPYDWRSPIVIDGYNAVIARVIRDLGGPQNKFTYVDTNFLVSPVWDSWKDWCHLSEKAVIAQAIYVASVAFGVIKLPV
jgi:hypothetical protein